MNKKDLSKAVLIMIFVFLSIWACFEIADAAQPKTAERIPVEIPAGTICFGNANGDYEVTDCGQMEVYDAQN